MKENERERDRENERERDREKVRLSICVLPVELTSVPDHIASLVSEGVCVCVWGGGVESVSEKKCV